MKIPPGHTEAQVIEAVEHALDALAKHYTFGSYDVEDIRSQGWIEALQVLEKDKYDPARPLANFMYTALKNALSNFRRNKFHRNDPPCVKCHTGNFCTEGGCQKYIEWRNRNRSKANIQAALGLENVSENDHRAHVDCTVEDDVATEELLRKIDRELPIELRTSYLQMRSGVSIPKARREQVEVAIREIIECQNEAN